LQSENGSAITIYVAGCANTSRYEVPENLSTVSNLKGSKCKHTCERILKADFPENTGAEWRREQNDVLILRPATLLLSVSGGREPRDSSGLLLS